jgi:hypothetical protein
MAGNRNRLGALGDGRSVRMGMLEGRKMTPTVADLRRAICCPRGVCIDQRNCYADDKSRAYPVHIHEAAEAVAKLLSTANGEYHAKTTALTTRARAKTA